ncbi:hypothetical protein [Lentzea flaviverrucosa]|uniref:Uncharacterized protein n=1 Tax=Lentzea flaviverrucosa TaxID=200379 RepID=A0A1H9H318_9PSEU|nr:hypothetical protein [Lentzea flaviverrucosa]RDI34718.1 hypothetical protein DFR72_101467 [Lentzea flaviverrucosa]SEQ56700.1 hypothetical protein SAMN05216195_102750 [Lentzea flaviverrucosa]
MTFPYDSARRQVQAWQQDLDAKGARLEKVALEASQVQTRGGDLSPADIAAIEKFARSKDAPNALKDLQRKVDSGAMSWQDIASGRAVGDPDVQRAMQTSMPSLKRAYTAIKEGQNLDEVVAAGQQRTRRSHGDFDDDMPSDFTEDAF